MIAPSSTWPAERRRETTWKTFLKARWDVLASVDFTTIDIWTRSGLATYYLLFFMELAKRRVHFAGLTANPDEAWILQVAMNVTDAEEGFLRGKKYVLMDRDGKFSEAFRARETGKNLFETIGYGVGLNPFAPGSKISKGMQYIGTEWVEDADRLATFMTALQRGFTPSEAGMLVDKILYDYSPLGLSMLESSVLKRIFPFYTWMKRNTPTMFKLLVTEPLVFQNLKRLSEGTFEAYGLDRSIMPDYLVQAAPVFALPIEDKDGNKVVLNLGIPIADVNRALEPSEIFSSMAPGIKWMMEYPQNYDPYYDKPIAATPGQKKRVPTMIYPVDFALSNKLTGPAWDAMLKHLGIVEQTDKFTGKKYLAGDAYAIKVMKDFMPLLNTLSKMGVDPLETGSQSAADFFGEIAGVKATPYDVDALTRYHEYEKFGQLQEPTRPAQQLE